MTSARGVVHSGVTLREYYQSTILAWWERNLKPSTIYGYKKNWRLYIEPKLGDSIISDLTTVDAGNFLDGLAMQGLNGTTISHVRNTTNLILAHAATKGIIAANPLRDALMTEKAGVSQPTYKYSMAEIRAILFALRGHLQAQTAIGLCYFAGLRPGEARAARWENYHAAAFTDAHGQVWDCLSISQSAWRKHVTDPKTKESVAVLPVAEPLRELLRLLHQEQGQPAEGWILKGERGGPLNLDVLSRELIRPRLQGASIQWHGYYGCRRGLGTVATDALKDPTGAAGMLRHKTIDTTAEHYVGITNEATMRAMADVGRLWQDASKQLPEKAGL